MKILIVSQHHVSEYVGGNEVYADTLASALVRLGHRVDYLATNGKKNFVSSYRLHIVPGYLRGKYTLPSPEWFKTIKRLKPDLVHASGSGVGITLAGWYCRIVGIRSVLTFQAPQRGSWLGKVDELLQVHSFDGIITTSPTNEAYIKRKTRNMVATVLLSLKPDFRFDCGLTKSSLRKRLGFREESKYIFMVAKLDEHHYYKGVETALGALSHLPSEYILVIGGTGSLINTYKIAAKTLGVRDRVIFLGFVAEADLALYYQAVDVFILPSTSESEGFGLVLLEAMACKTPVVTTVCVGISSYLARKKLAKIVAPNSALELAQAIEASVNNDSQVPAAYEFAMSRTPKTLAVETQKVYEKLIPTL